MSFTVQQLVLNNSSVNMHKHKLCSKCGQEKPPEGGVDMRPGVWHCAPCWTKRAIVPKPRR